MSNMSYCRFRNTLSDLEDCAEALDGLLNQRELVERKRGQEERMRQLEEISEDIGLSAAQDEEYGQIETAMDDEADDILDDEERDAAFKLVELCREIANAGYEGDLQV